MKYKQVTTYYDPTVELLFKQSGLTYRVLADKLHLDYSLIHKYLTGKRAAPEDTYRQIKRMLLTFLMERDK